MTILLGKGERGGRGSELKKNTNEKYEKSVNTRGRERKRKYNKKKTKPKDQNRDRIIREKVCQLQQSGEK